MTCYNLYETFVVHQYSLDKWQVESNNNSYFEIIFIEEGNGYYDINGLKFWYKEHDIFLLTKGDTHRFQITKHSKFTLFRFTELLLSGKVNLLHRKYWLQCIEQLLHHPTSIPAAITLHEDDRKTLWDMHDIAIEEFKNEKIYHQEIISNIINIILSIIVRNITYTTQYKNRHKNISEKDSKVELILGYIRRNVHDNELTKIHKMAHKFKMSQSSLSSCFKKTTGESIHQYITKYKMDLVKYRLLQTEFTIAEIARQLGYTDESHLTKMFKKHYTMSPKQYREELILSR